MQLLKFECLKLKYSRSFKTVILFSMVFGFASTAISSLLSDGQIIFGYEAFFQQFAELRILIFVFAGVLSGLLIGEDFSSRAVQSEIASGYSRFSVILNKTISYMAGVCILIIIQVLIGTLVPTVVHGFGVNLTLVILGNMLRAVLMFAVLTCAISMIYVVTSFWLKNVGTTIAVNMLLLVVIDGLFQVGAMLSTLGMNIYEATPFVQMLLTSAEKISNDQIFKAMSIGSVISLIFFLFAYALFYRTELK